MTGRWYSDADKATMRKKADIAEYNAFMNSMAIMGQGGQNPAQAINAAADYMSAARQETLMNLAGERYGVDVKKLTAELEKGKDAFVDLGNGNVSRFKGFDDKGNILVEALTDKPQPRFQ
jgi:6-phosphogluconate dehydrogenase (decarboxylating)